MNVITFQFWSLGSWLHYLSVLDWKSPIHWKVILNNCLIIIIIPLIIMALSYVNLIVTTCFTSRICSNEYQIFNKIIKLDYDVPPDLDDTSKDLIRNLLVSNLFQKACLYSCMVAHWFVDLRFCSQTGGLDAKKWVDTSLSDLTLSFPPQHGTRWKSSVPRWNRWRESRQKNHQRTQSR